MPYAYTNHTSMYAKPLFPCKVCFIIICKIKFSIVLSALPPETERLRDLCILMTGQNVDCY